MKGRLEGAEERSKVTNLTIGHMTTSGKSFLWKGEQLCCKKRNVTMMMDGRLTRNSDDRNAQRTYIFGCVCCSIGRSQYRRN